MSAATASDTEAPIANRLPVGFVTCDGHSSDAVFLLRRIDGQTETLGDRLNGRAEAFLRCEIGGRQELIRRSWIAYVRYSGHLPEVDDRIVAGASPVPVEFDLLGGGTVRGELLSMLPSSHRRLADLLRAPGVAFLLVLKENETLYVNRSAIVRVRSD